MSELKLVAIDLAKNCYQVAGFNGDGKLQYNRKYSAAKFAVAMQQLEPTVIAMEAAYSADVGRAFRVMPATDSGACRPGCQGWRNCGGGRVEGVLNGAGPRVRGFV